jgi:hypothetical protein
LSVLELELGVEIMKIVPAAAGTSNVGHAFGRKCNPTATMAVSRLTNSNTAAKTATVGLGAGEGKTMRRT